MEDSNAVTTPELSEWSLLEVATWLKTLEFDQDLVTKFNENNITGEILPYLKDEHFQEMELPLKDRIRLKIEVNKLLDDEGYVHPQDVRHLKNILININDMIITNVETSTRFINDEFYKLKEDLSKLQKPLPTPEKNPSSPFNLTSPTKPTTTKSTSSHSNSPNDHHSTSNRKSLDFKSKSQRNSTILPNVQSPTSGTTSVAPPPVKPVSEPLKQLRASTDDPCSKILQAAMKRHKLNDDWRNYALVICYGDRERILELDEKPVQIFKELRDKGEHPAIMLRQKSNYVDTRGAPGGKL